MHLSVEELRKLISKSWSIDSSDLNLNAMIEIRGDSPDFMEFFSEFLKIWKSREKDSYLDLRPKNMEKLQAIDGAIELLLEDVSSIG